MAIPIIIPYDPGCLDISQMMKMVNAFHTSVKRIHPFCEIPRLISKEPNPQVMERIDIPATSSTPSVHYGADGKLKIKGRSLPEDVTAFFNPLVDWAGKLAVHSLTVDVELVYMNSASSKKLLELLKALDTNNRIRELYINWFYEEGDEDGLENGQIYEELLQKASFQYHEYNETM